MDRVGGWLMGEAEVKNEEKKASHGSRGSHYFCFQNKTQVGSRNYKFITKFCHSQQNGRISKTEMIHIKAQSSVQHDLLIPISNYLPLEKTENNSTLGCKSSRVSKLY